MKIFLAVSEKFIKECPSLHTSLQKSIEKISSNNALLLEKTDGPKKLSSCDIVIAEDTFASTDVGYTIASAVDLKKQILILRLTNEPEEKRVFVSNSDNRKSIKAVKYTEETIENEIYTFVNEVQNKLDTKFILIISPKIDRYLDWVNKNRRMHKAQAVRRALENMMEEDTNYPNIK